MPINIAHNGAVSDRSKREGPGAISFSFTGVSIMAMGNSGPLDLGAGVGFEAKIGPGQTLGVDPILGTSTPTNAVSIGALGGPGVGFLNFTFHMLGDGGLGSKRTTQYKTFGITTATEYDGDPLSSQLEFLTSHQNPANPYLNQFIDGIEGEVRHSIGRWGNEDFGNEYQSTFPRPGGSQISRGDPPFETNFGVRDDFIIFCDAISEGGQSDATGIFRINRGGLVVFDEFTGQYLEVPTNDFEFSIKVVT